MLNIYENRTFYVKSMSQAVKKDSGGRSSELSEMFKVFRDTCIVSSFGLNTFKFYSVMNDPVEQI